MFTKHTEVINYIIEKKGFTSYLEIGVNNPAMNFDLIKCRFKIGVDPNGRANFTGTSDEFFWYWSMWTDVDRLNPAPIDCIFIDGLHHADQVAKDITNSLSLISDNGIIVIHDTDPKEERFAVVPRVERGRWNGNVFKIMPWLNNSEFPYKTLDFEANGLTIFKAVEIIGQYENPTVSDISYADFKARRLELLNLCTTKEFIEWI